MNELKGEGECEEDLSNLPHGQLFSNMLLMNCHECISFILFILFDCPFIQHRSDCLHYVRCQLLGKNRAGNNCSSFLSLGHKLCSKNWL